MPAAPSVTVLTIDDERIVRESIRNFLEDSGYRVLEAENGRVGLQVFERESPDLVLVDLRMPEVDGLEVLAALAKRHPDVPVIVVSGTGLIADAVEAVKLGAWDYVLKPIQDMSVLEHAVRKALERARLIRENRKHQAHLEEEVRKQTAELRQSYNSLRREMITRTKAEAALRASEETFRALAENSRDVIVRFDRHMRHMYVNPIVSQIADIPLEEYLGKTHRELGFPEDLVVSWEEAIAQVFDTGRLNRIEFQLPSGMWLDWLLVPEFASGGDVKAVITSARDITERKHAEEALRESEERYRVLFESSSDAIGIIKDTILVDCNQQALDLFQRSREQIVGLHPWVFAQLTQPENADLRAATIKRLRLAAQGHPQFFEWRNKRWDGTEFDSEVSLKRVVLGEEILLQVIVRDVTERKRVEKEKTDLEARLRQAQKMEAVGQLAGGVAHDFNNLLQAIQGYVDMAIGDLPENHPVREDLEQVARAGDRAATLVRQLLTFSRRERLQPQALRLDDLVGDLLKMLQRVLGAHVELVFKANPDLKAIYADPGQVEQVIMNLCVNARDAMAGGGAITVSLENADLDAAFCWRHPWAVPGRYVRLSVADAGEGMSPEVVEHIFEPFFTTKEAGKGTGLGLATVYGVVQQHQGLIDVGSTPGEGTVFNVYFPLKGPGGEEVKQAPERAAVEGGHETILLAEDDELVRALIVRILSGAGYNLLVARDGEEAIDLFEQHHADVDLAVLDVVMPKKGGRAVFDRIRALRPGVGVLFCSAYSMDFLDADALPDENFEFLRKPCGATEMLRAVRSMLSSQG
ncbi:MAG: response regulator [Nitrospiraceae bacterium]|nr:response regulator [Nitrospiraceae bacterium]